MSSSFSDDTSSDDDGQFDWQDPYAANYPYGEGGNASLDSSAEKSDNAIGVSDAFVPIADSSDDEDDTSVPLPEREPMDDEMDITPMIDMTFLLLIFFVLTSKMTAERSYETPPAKHGSSISTKACVMLTVTRGMGETPIVSKADGAVFSDDPEQQSAEIAEYLQMLMETGGKTEVLIRAESNVTAKQLKKVELAIAEVLEPGKMINLSVSEAGR
jgi:biopolymer transport protein ExbD